MLAYENLRELLFGGHTHTDWTMKKNSKYIISFILVDFLWYNVWLKQALSIRSQQYVNNQ